MTHLRAIPPSVPALGAAALLAAAFAAGCSMFEPRTPEDPAEGGSYWQYPSAPSIVMNNLDGSMEARSITLYMTAFDESFAFLADPADTAEFPSLEFGSWDFYAEQNTLSNMFASVQGSGAPEESLIAVTFMPIEGYPDPPAPVDSAEIWRSYFIQIAGSEYGSWSNPCIGKACITMIEDESSMWSISVWEDYRPDDYVPGIYTWGVVKAPYR